MLGRAVHKYQPPPPQKRAEALSPPNVPSTQTTFDSMKSSRQSSQSIGGFTNLTNSSATSYNNQSRPSYQSKPAYNSKSSNAVKRTSSGLSKTLSAGSFQDESSSAPRLPTLLSRSSTVGSTASSRTASGDSYAVSGSAYAGSNFVSNPPAYEFDPDEFDNDSDLDLDVEYPQALPPQSMPRMPLQDVSPNPSQVLQPDAAPEMITPRQAVHPSSALSWSQSPLSHMEMPSGVMQKHTADIETLAPPMSSEASIDANPRPAKRRTVPWLERKAESKKMEEKDEPDSSPAVVCFKCRKPGHTRAECPNAAKYTPQSKDKAMPWNTTASAVKAQQKQKKLVKENAFSNEMMRESIQATRSNKARQAPIFLSEEQKNVLNLVTTKGKSVFFTGSAGTGKSVLMKAIIAELRRQYVREPDRVAVTASTGLAACNIGGVTLHSFGGIGLGKEEVPELVKKINRNQKAKQRWIRTKILIIDEISMVDGALFDKLEGIARMIRKNGRPFGGIQLVITGDFFQLPPVPDFGNRQVKFAFDAGTWSTAINHTIGLTEVFRQRDPVFANMLNEMRLGKITDETVKAFRRLDRPIQHEDHLEATELFPTRAEVERSNQRKMQNLVGSIFVFKAIDGGSMKDIAARDKLLSNCMAPPVIELKKGAQVMLIKNIDDMLVNGSLGQVVAFMDERSFEIYDSKEERVDPTNFDEDTADECSGEARQKLKSMTNNGLIADTSFKFPLVRFSIADGTTRDLLCQPEDWKVELPNGEVQAQRRQLPLILAWALSIHKAQGQTLERVKVDLRKVFENGQAYVALSRATCQDGLQVSGFDKSKVTAHPRVGEFYNTLYSVNRALKHPKVASNSAVTKKAHEYENDLMEGQGLLHNFDDDEEEAMAAYG